MKNLSVKQVVNNGIISVVFQAFPVLVALYFVPKNIALLGNQMWAIYSLAVTFLFVFMYFNLGVGPATSKFLAESLGDESEDESLQAMLSTSFFTTFLIAVFLTLVLIAVTPYLVDFFVTDQAFREVSLSLFRVAILCGSFSLMISFFRSVFEALQRFMLVSVLRSILSSSILIAPFFMSMFPLTIVECFWFVLGVYFLVLLFYFACYVRLYSIPVLGYASYAQLKRVLSFGFWVSLSAAIAPVYIFLDRFVIAKFLGLEQVAYYTTVYDMASRFTMLSGSFSAALFPAVSYWFVNGKFDQLYFSFAKTIKYLALLSTIAVVLSLCFSAVFIEYWIDSEYSENSSSIFNVLIVAYALSGLSLVFLRYFYGIGKPQLVFWVSLLQMPFYICALYFCAKYLDTFYVACCFLVKSLLDLLIFTVLFYKEKHKHVAKV